MRIAFTHNLKKSEDESEAEFDSPETVAFISGAITASGHECIPVDVTGSLLEILEKVRASNPDLIFNTAEGTSGKMREAIYPLVFDELGIPYVGSDAHCLTVTLDKYLTNLAVEQMGVRIPKSRFVTSFDPHVTFDLPCIVKPNFEGSSKGVLSGSVVTNLDQLRVVLARMLRAYPDGVLIQEFIEGRDAAVGYIEGLGAEVLTPCSYDYPGASSRIYDYALKNGPEADTVKVHCPANFSNEIVEDLWLFSYLSVCALGLRGLARFDFRVRESDGAVFFLEVNANPALGPGCTIYEAAAADFRYSPVDVIGHAIQHAGKRAGKIKSILPPPM